MCATNRYVRVFDTTTERFFSVVIAKNVVPDTRFPILIESPSPCYVDFRRRRTHPGTSRTIILNKYKFSSPSRTPRRVRSATRARKTAGKYYSRGTCPAGTYADIGLSVQLTPEHRVQLTGVYM